MERATYRNRFDIYLHNFLQKKIDEMSVFALSTDLQTIFNFLHPYSTGGKRVRPYLVYLVYRLCKGNDEQTALHAGLVNELIHLFALIHDDINDQGVTRHHQPTFHKFAEHQLGDYHQGVNMGILIGDALLSRAYELLHQLPADSHTKQHYFTMVNTTLYGQIQDIYLSYTPQLYDSNIIAQKDNAKSGHYTFMSPMIIGASLAGRKEYTAIASVGEKIGLAYQMRDDLYDIIDAHGDKTPFSDHQEGNQTFLFAHAYEHATTTQKAYFLETRGKSSTAEIRQKLLDIYTQTGTIERATIQINSLLEQASQQIHERHNDTSYNHKYIAHLQHLINYLVVTS